MHTVKKKRAAQPLFQSVGDDGTLWLFVCFSGDGWAITRNGEQIEIGTADQRSVHSGVQKFLTFTRARVDARLVRREEVVTASSA